MKSHTGKWFAPGEKNLDHYLSLLIGVMLIMSILLFSGPVFAEGSRDLTSEGGYRPYTERYNATTAGEERLTVIGAYVKKGETVAFGSSVNDANLKLTNEKMGTNLSADMLATLNQNDISVCSPRWDAAKNPDVYPFVDGTTDRSVSFYNIDKEGGSDARGYIANRAQEEAGANADGGYKPFTFVAQYEGIYYFRFYSSAMSAKDPKLTTVGNDEDFSKNQGSATVAAWDVSVFNGDELQSGRVFTDKLFLNMGGNKPGNSVLNSAVYVLTEDGYEYEMNFNGMDPFGFLFFSNSRGLLQQTGSSYQSLYHSVKSNNNTLSDFEQNGINSNAEPTEAADKTHRIFFNQPDAFALKSYTGNEQLSDGTLSEANALTFTPAYDPENTKSGTVVGFGGTFNLDNTAGNMNGTSFQITLTFADNNKVVLSNALVEGMNHVVWDGKDAFGNVVPPGDYNHAVSVQVKGGEVHFPLFDVENNREGLEVTMMNDIDGIDKSIIYYNNKSNQSSYPGSWNESNWTVADKQDESDGVPSAGGAMKYGNSAGDKTALDVWTYHSNSTEVGLRFSIYDVPRDFVVNKVWENEADPDKPEADTEITVQLYWRVAHSGNEWAIYDGKNNNNNDGFHDYTKEVSFPSNADYTFSNLEFYAGGLDKQGDPLCYEYYAQETAPVINNYFATEELGDLDEFGIAGSETITNAYEPERGLIKVSKVWSGDEAASRVRPQRIRVKAFY